MWQKDILKLIEADFTCAIVPPLSGDYRVTLTARQFFICVSQYTEKSMGAGNLSDKIFRFSHKGLNNVASVIKERETYLATNLGN